MKQVLRIDSSLFAANGVSQQLTQELLLELQQLHGPLALVQRDLAAEGVPHLDAERVQALATPAEQRNGVQQQLVAESDRYLNELLAAELLIIGAPMYNFNVPSVLKAWFDHVARAGVSFAYTETGPQGLLRNKTAYVITTRGGLHQDRPSDTEIPFIKNFLAFLGIHDVHVIYAEGLNMGVVQREQGLQAARDAIQRLIAA